MAGIHGKALLSDNFASLSSNVFLREPLSTTTDRLAPSTIIVLGWLNALPRHLRKYIAGYNSMYPTARVILVLTTSREAIQSDVVQQARLERVLEAVLSETEPRILVHCFSNGGAAQLCHLARAYKHVVGKAHASVTASDVLLPINATIMDSCPGKLRFQQGIRAYKTGLPANPLLYALGSLAAYPTVAVAGLFLVVSGHRDPIERMRGDLLNVGLFEQDAPRCYIFSKTDKLVDFADVETHIREATGSGFKVQSEIFEGSEHVSHIAKDEKRYWEAVQNTWESRVKKGWRTSAEPLLPPAIRPYSSKL